MRERLFRGKPTKDSLKSFTDEFVEHFVKEGWVYGSLVKTVEGFAIVGEVIANDFDIVEYRYWVDVIPETVGQLTEVLDAYDQKIFEGDIIAFLDGMGGIDNTTVVYNGGAFCVDTQNDEVDLMPLAWTPKEFMKVVGNIHDNPELLEEV